MILPEMRQQPEYHRFDPRRWLPSPRTRIDRLIGEEARPKPERLTLVFINGRGSSGKDTQADLLAQNVYPGAIRISTGDIVRGAQDPNSEFFKYNGKLKEFFEASNAGAFVPDREMLEVVQDVIEDIIENKLQQENVVNGQAVFIFTGFPRTIGQDEAINSVLSEGLREHFPVDHLHILYDVPPEISQQRAQIRRDTPGIPQRRDDQIEVVDRRLNEYMDQTLPTMYNRIYGGDHLIVVPAIGTIEEIHAITVARLQEHNKKRHGIGAFIAEHATVRRLRENDIRNTYRNLVNPFRKLAGKRPLDYSPTK